MAFSACACSWPRPGREGRCLPRWWCGARQFGLCRADLGAQHLAALVAVIVVLRIDRHRHRVITVALVEQPAQSANIVRKVRQ